MTIDPTKLPFRALLDSSVLISAFFGNRPEDVDSDELFRTMVNQRRDVLIASVSLAEILRKQAVSPLPTVRHVRTVSFDARCAEVCARYFPPKVLKEDAAKLAGFEAAYWKYDTLIVATAIAYGAECLVTRDAGQTKLAARAGLKAVTPSFFQGAQLSLPSTAVVPKAAPTAPPAPATASTQSSGPPPKN